MPVRVHGPRRIENAERSFDAIKRVELGQDHAAAGLNPGDLERVLILACALRVSAIPKIRKGLRIGMLWTEISLLGPRLST